MLIKVSKTNRSYLVESYFKFKSGDYQVILRNTIFSLMKTFEILKRSADYQKYMQLYDSLFTYKNGIKGIEKMLPNEVEVMAINLLKTIDEVNADYDKNAATHSSFTLEGTISPIFSNNSIYVYNPDTTLSCRVFVDRLNIKVKAFIKEHQGQKVKVTGFMSSWEEGTGYDAMPVATNIEFLK